MGEAKSAFSRQQISTCIRKVSLNTNPSFHAFILSDGDGGGAGGGGGGGLGRVGRGVIFSVNIHQTMCTCFYLAC